MTRLSRLVEADSVEQAVTIARQVVQRIVEMTQGYLEAGNMAMRSPRKDPTQRSLPIGIATVPDAKDSVFG
jgi:hypothetical protein